MACAVTCQGVTVSVLVAVLGARALVAEIARPSICADAGAIVADTTIRSAALANIRCGSIAIKHLLDIARQKVAGGPLPHSLALAGANALADLATFATSVAHLGTRGGEAAFANEVISTLARAIVALAIATAVARAPSQLAGSTPEVIIAAAGAVDAGAVEARRRAGFDAAVGALPSEVALARPRNAVAVAVAVVETHLDLAIVARVARVALARAVVRAHAPPAAAVDAVPVGAVATLPAGIALAHASIACPVPRAFVGAVRRRAVGPEVARVAHAVLVNTNAFQRALVRARGVFRARLARVSTEARADVHVAVPVPGALIRAPVGSLDVNPTGALVELPNLQRHLHCGGSHR